MGGCAQRVYGGRQCCGVCWCSGVGHLVTWVELGLVTWQSHGRLHGLTLGGVWADFGHAMLLQAPWQSVHSAWRWHMLVPLCACTSLSLLPTGCIVAATMWKQEVGATRVGGGTWWDRGHTGTRLRPREAS